MIIITILCIFYFADDHNHYNKQHPNEVVKNEELTYNSGGSCFWINSTLVLSILAILGINYIVDRTIIHSTPSSYSQDIKYER